MIGQDHFVGTQLCNRVGKTFEDLRSVNGWCFAIGLIKYLGDDAARHAILVTPQINQNEFGIRDLGVELWCQCFANIMYWGEGRDDERHGCNHLLGLILILPGRGH